MRRLPITYLKELFTGPPDIYVLQQRHDVAGVLAALDHTLPWVRRNAAETLGNMHHQQARVARLRRRCTTAMRRSAPPRRWRLTS